MNKQIFTIHEKLPSFNTYTDKCRTNKYSGHKFKQNLENIISAYIYKYKVKPVINPVFIHYVWSEKTRKRDKDNVYSAKKFIADALQKTNIIPNDNNKWVLNHRDYITYAQGQKVIVILEEMTTEEYDIKYGKEIEQLINQEFSNLK